MYIIDMEHLVVGCLPISSLMDRKRLDTYEKKRYFDILLNHNNHFIDNIVNDTMYKKIAPNSSTMN